jgi:hypothetical protein
MTDTTKKALSCGAQAVLDAFLTNWPDNPLASDRQCLGDAIIALADQVVPLEPYYENCDVVREEILDIAFEIKEL